MSSVNDAFLTTPSVILPFLQQNVPSVAKHKPANILLSLGLIAVQSPDSFSASTESILGRSLAVSAVLCGFMYFALVSAALAAFGLVLYGCSTTHRCRGRCEGQQRGVQGARVKIGELIGNF